MNEKNKQPNKQLQDMTREFSVMRLSLTRILTLEPAARGRVLDFLREKIEQAESDGVLSARAAEPVIAPADERQS